jgi:hypothetical protein
MYHGLPHVITAKYLHTPCAHQPGSRWRFPATRMSTNHQASLSACRSTTRTPRTSSTRGRRSAPNEGETRDGERESDSDRGDDHAQGSPILGVNRPVLAPSDRSLSPVACGYSASPCRHDFLPSSQRRASARPQRSGRASVASEARPSSASPWKRKDAHRMPDPTPKREPRTHRSLDWLRLTAVIVSLIRLLIEWRS